MKKKPEKAPAKPHNPARSSAKGKYREYKVRDLLIDAGYKASLISRSGAAISEKAKAGGIPADIVGYSTQHGLPHIWAEVGGIGKRLEVSFARLTRDGLPPGVVPLVVRAVERKWWYYTSPSDRFSTLNDALEYVRA